MQHLKTISFFAFPALLFCAQPAPKIDMGEFSADVVRTMETHVVKGKIFIKTDKMRDENVMQGRTTVTIIRLDKQLCWTLMDNKQYMEIASVDQKNIVPLEKNYEKKYQIKSLGKEKINGYLCEVKQYTDTEHPDGETTQWFSPKLKYMIKMEHTKNGKLLFKQELTNINEGAVNASLFEIPPGYTKFDPMSQIPPSMRGMIPADMLKNMGNPQQGKR